MLLSDVDIRKALANRAILIEPPPEDRQIQSASLDIHLGTSFARWMGPGGLLNVATGELRGAEAMIRWEAERQELEPLSFMLAVTKERITLRNAIGAHVDGRSTKARCGLVVHATAGFIDPGWDGEITLELFNMSPHTLVLTAGMSIAQLVFQPLSSPCERPYGHPGLGSKYQGQQGATPAR